MNQRLITGCFMMAISLALVGAAVNAQDLPQTKPDADLASLAVAEASAPVERAQATAVTAQVPVRSADPDNQAELWNADDEPAPTTVRIEAIGLEAQVRSVGVDEDNQFDVPEAQTVGWYKHGSAPGETGSTVLAAHVAYAGRPGAFLHLDQVEVGQHLEVELSDGSIARYRVIDNTLYDKTDLPADELFRKEGDEVLRLITCGGTFDPVKRSYRGNVVVTAEPVSA